MTGHDPQLTQVMADLDALGVRPITVSATGLDGQPRTVRVKLRTITDRDRVAKLGNGWELSVAQGVL